MVALFVLSLVALFIAEISHQFVSAYKVSRQDLNETKRILAARSSPSNPLEIQTLTIDGQTFQTATRFQEDAPACLYDVIGRRCR